MKTRNKLYDKSRLRLLCLLTALLGIFGAGQTWAQTKPSSGDGTQENPYQISTADELRWFAGLVNGTLTDGTAKNNAACAVLTTNIDLGGAAWTPIGSESNQYTGTFDGADHTIDNLVVNNSGANYQGFVGYLNNGIIKNLNLGTNCSVTGSNNVGGICAFNQYGTIQNCSNSGSVSGSYYVGGICGYNNYGTVTYCHNTGSISCTKYRVGGICGSSFGTVTYCYNTGSISGSHGGGICGQNGNEILYCYSIGKMAAGSIRGGICGYNDGGTITNCYCCSETSEHTIATSYGTCTVEKVERLESNAFASGEVAYLLNGSNPGEDNVWRQNLDNGETVDQLPVLDNTHGIVYLISMDCSGRPSATSRYTNDEEAASGPGEHTFGDDGFCTVCGGYEPAEKNENGSYEISNVGQLFWFAALVNGDNTYAVFDSQDAAASATLTTDIIIPKERKWTPIGNTDNYYTGAFDGQGHAIENLVVESFGYASRGFVGGLGSAGKIQNLALKNCSVAGASNAGGLCGWNQGAIINCSCTGTVSGATAGGLCGENGEGGTVTNCWSNVAVTGSPYVGGFCAINYRATVTNCYSTGTVECTSASANYVGGFCGDNSYGGISNCYWLDVAYSGDGIGDGTQTGAEVMSVEQFMSGEVCWLLQNGQDAQAWGQTLDTDDYPVLTTDEAMRVYAAKLYQGSADKVSELYDNNASGFSNSGEPNALLVIEDEATTAPAGTNVVVKSGDAYTCANLVLTDGADFYTPVAFTAAQATYSRPLAEGTQWGTVALPFDATSVTGAELFRVASQDGDALYVDETNVMAGGEPLVFRANAEVTEVGFNGTNVTVRATDDEAGSTLLKGTSQTVNPLTAGTYFIYGDKFYQVASGSQIGVKPFRAYIPAAAGASTRSAGAASQLRIIFNADK